MNKLKFELTQQSALGMCMRGNIGAKPFGLVLIPLPFIYFFHLAAVLLKMSSVPCIVVNRLPGDILHFHSSQKAL